MSDRRTVELDLNDLVARPLPENGDNDGDASSPRRKTRAGGGGSEAAAERRRLAAELREHKRLERQAVAAQKKAERTRSQVRVQALNLGRKYHSLVASKAPYGGDDDDGDNSFRADNNGRGELRLAPIVRHADGSLFLAHTRGGGGEYEPASEFENSFQTLHKLAMAPADPLLPRRPPPSSSSSSSSGAVVDASGGMPVTHRATFRQDQLLPGVPVALASTQQQQQQLPVVAGAVPFFAPTAATYTLPGIAIGDPSPSSGAASSSSSGASGGGLLAPPPQFGVLRGGTTQRRRHREDVSLGMSEDQRREQARLEKELQDLAVSKQYENLTRLYNTLPELRTRAAASAATTGGAAGQQQGSVTQRRYMPQQRRTVRRVFRVGRTPDGDQLSMLTHSTATKASVDDFRLQMQNMSTDKMRRALLAAKILTAGSEAPEALVRRIFHQRQLIVGDLAVTAPPNRKRPLESVNA